MKLLASIDFRDTDPARAAVPVLDRGFLFGDSVFEVVRTYDGRPFLLREHLERLAHSARLVHFPFEPDLDRLEAEARRLFARWAAEAGGEAQLRLVVTRGRGELAIDPADAHEPCTVALVRPLRAPDARLYEEGASVAVVQVRRNLAQAIPPAAKTGNYLNAVLALAEARELGAYEPVLLDHRGRVAEGATSNVFVVRGGELATPRGDAGILGGLTRRALLEVAPRAGLRAVETDLLPGELASAAEVLLTSTAREVLPVSSLYLDGAWHRIGDGHAGPHARRLLELYRAWARRQAA